jgi:D-amino-acid dehydrogenase
VKQIAGNTPLDTERGYHIMLRTPAHSIQRPVTVNSPGYTLAQMEDGLRLTTGIEFAGIDAAADFRRIRRMVGHVKTLMPQLDTEPQAEWLGFRPSMPHSLPVIGPARENPNVILAYGHGHLGVTLAPTTGRIVAAVVDRTPMPIDVTAFLPR